MQRTSARRTIRSRFSHRARQFFGGLRPRVSPEQRSDAYRWLTPPQQALFETMMLRDQQHGIHVYGHVREACAGSEDPVLFAAALLHDCGKGRVAMWQRILHVVLSALAPWLYARLASERGAEWRRAFWRLRYHPDIGADLALAAGIDADGARLIREQDAPSPDERLALLQAADNA
jgi:hypothetical protein